MKYSKKQFVFLTLFIITLFLGLGSLAAADTNITYTETETDIDIDIDRDMTTQIKNTEENEKTLTENIQKEEQIDKNKNMETRKEEKKEINNEKRTDKIKTIKKETQQKNDETGNTTIVNVTNYNELKQAIDTSTTESIIINLEQGTYDAQEKLTLTNQITKNITIEGNGQILTSSNTSITPYLIDIGNGFNVYLNNITISEIKSSPLQGIIHSNFANIMINNSKFINNNEVIYSDFSNITIDNSIFRNNSVDMEYRGIITVYRSNMRISNSFIENNTAKENYNGIINNRLLSKSEIINTTITNNQVENNVILNEEKLIINNTNILNNIATKHGGAIKNRGNITIIYSNMINNTATGYGGAIYNEEGNITISNSNMKNNTAAHDGGAINNYGNITIFNSNIMDNTATGYGGAIYNNNSINITNTTLSNNTAEYGGVIYSMGNVTIDNSTIKNNPVERTGVLYIDNGSTILKNSIIIDNKAGNALNNSYIISYFTSSMLTQKSIYINIYNNKFYNNTDYVRDMLIQDYSMSPKTTVNTYNNTYKGNYLETSTNVTINDKILNFTEKEYDINIPLNIRQIYNDTVQDGHITILINGIEYKKYQVNNGMCHISIPRADFNNTENNITYNYNSTDNSYQPLTLHNTVILKHDTKTVIDPINGLLGKNVSFTAHVTDNDGTLINEGYVIFKINNVTLKDSEGNPIRVNVTNGTATLTTIATWNNANNTTAVYSGTDRYETSRIENGTINIARQNVTVNLTIQNGLKPGAFIAVVNVTDMDNKPVDTGNILFKMNGKTMKYIDGSQVRKNVTNGTVTIRYMMPVNFSAKDYNLTAVYTGNIYNRAETTTNFTLSKRDAKINMTVDSEDLKPGSTLIATANVTDIEGFPVTTGSVTFKLNGKTLRYTNGSSIKIAVVNGTAKLNYTIPGNYTAKTYTLTAEYNAGNYNTVETSQNITLSKINTYIQPNNITINGNKLTVKANIINNETKEIADERNNTVSIKLDKHTVIKEVTVNNGVIDLSTNVNIKPGVHTIEIVTSGNGIYNSCRKNFTVNNPILIIDNPDNTIKIE